LSTRGPEGELKKTEGQDDFHNQQEKPARGEKEGKAEEEKDCFWGRKKKRGQIKKRTEGSKSGEVKGTNANRVRPSVRELKQENKKGGRSASGNKKEWKDTTLEGKREGRVTNDKG